MPTNRQRENRVVLHLTDEELRLLNSKTEKAGLSREAFLRKAIKRNQIKSVRLEPLIELNKQLKGLSNNLNQLTRYHNSGYFSPQDYERLQETERGLNELWPLLKQFLLEAQRGEP